MKKWFADFWFIIRKQGLVFNCIYVLLLLGSVWNDLHFFDFAYADSGDFYVPSGSPHYILFYTTLKVAFACLVYLVMLYGKKIIKGVLCKNADAKRYLVFFLIIFVSYFFFLMLCWPGIWWCTGADEFYMVYYTRHLQVQFHQGFMMAFVYFMAFMVWSNPVMVVILQMFIGAVCYAWILSDLWKKTRWTSIVLLIMVVLSPCGIYFALYPMRAYLTGVFLGTFIYLYICIIQSDNICIKDCMYLFAVGSLVINSRSEMKLLIVFIPVLFIKNMRTSIREVKKVLCITLCLCMSVIFIRGWEKLGNHGCSVTHNLISFFAPLGEILVQDGNEIKIEELILLDKFIVINRLIEEHRVPGNELNYSGYERLRSPNSIYDSKELMQAKVIMAKIMLEHPRIYIQNKMLLAKRTFGILKGQPNRHHFPDKIYPEEVADMFWQINPTVAGWVKDKLAGDFYIGDAFAFKYLYAMWFPVLLIMFDFAISIIKRDRKYLAMELFLITLFVIVFLMAMHGYTMYYFAPYVGVCFLLVISVSEKIRKV